MPSAIPSDCAIVVYGVSKSFRLPREQVHTLKESALHPFRRREHDEFAALRDVYFHVAPGEFFGIVGRNGSGKSTLLKCMAGIYRADRGQVFINGRLSTFIELGVGFNPDLAAYDNVMLNATMLGLTQREARRRYDQVIDFAELREFADLKIKNYSSGMLVRLAFAVMIQVDADILLIDEVLAVGDAAFQQKCFDEFARIRRNGTTVVLVTHDMGAVERFCDRAMLLERGVQVDIGDTEAVAARYLKLNFSSEAREEIAARADDATSRPEPAEDDAARALPTDPEDLRLGDGRAEIVEVWFEDESGGRTDSFATREPFACALRVHFNEDLTDPAVTIELENAETRPVAGATTLHQPGLGRYAAGSEATFRFTFENRLAPDRYHATVAIAADLPSTYWIDRRVRAASMVVAGVTDGGWLADLPARFDVVSHEQRTAEAGR